jgi:hypothetical protein
MKAIQTTLLLALLGSAAITASGASPEQHHGLGAGVRVLQHHDHFADLPYDGGDLAYGLAYEYHEAMALWQIACFYAPTVGDENTVVNYVITPELNLMFKDSIWRGGLGILDSYIDSDITGGDWTDVYWQFILGLDIPLGRSIHLVAQAHHVFETWGEAGQVDVGEFEYTGWLSYRF